MEEETTENKKNKKITVKFRTPLESRRRKNNGKQEKEENRCKVPKAAEEKTTESKKKQEIAVKFRRSQKKKQRKGRKSNVWVGEWRKFSKKE